MIDVYIAIDVLKSSHIMRKTALDSEVKCIATFSKEVDFSQVKECAYYLTGHHVTKIVMRDPEETFYRNKEQASHYITGVCNDFLVLNYELVTEIESLKQSNSLSSVDTNEVI